ncbi:MAG: GNAT family N-acetyltransferase [Melioribacteraceae bacterium]|nr:GNAT family N-acetyltransferase [Melioribacteraceae bacterium]
MNNISFNPFPVIKTDRLLLRKISKEDKINLFTLRTDKSVNQFIDRPAPTSLNDIDNFITKIEYGINLNEWINWVITDKENHSFIGLICFWNFSENKFTAETGYEMLPQFQGKGIMNEALKAIISFGFNELNLREIEAYTHYKNEASKRLLIKNNFKEDKTRVDKKNSDIRIYVLKNIFITTKT